MKDERERTEQNMTNPDSRPSGMTLVYKGDGDYDVIAGPVVIELAYDGSDIMVGDWVFWNVRVGDQRFGGTQHVGPGPFFDWLEAEARKDGLSEEPDGR
jgi:hypothetical protein